MSIFDGTKSNQETISGLSLINSSVLRTNSVIEMTKSDADVIFFEGDCSDLLKMVDTETIEMVITSPPYNVGKSYETQTPLDVYIKTQEVVLEELYRVISPTGSMCWQTGNFVDNGEVFPLDVYFYPLFKELGLKLRNRIVWKFDHGLHASKRLSGRYETIPWFTKGDNYTFNLDPIRVPAKYPGKRHFKGPKKGQLSGNPLGKNPSDMWDVVQQDWETGVWNIPNVKSNHPEKTVHPCQFPVELVERCVVALTNPGDTVLDPYCGVGTSAVAAAMHGRKALGADAMSEYIDIAEDRIERLRNGTLKIRPLGKPIHQPSGREKVSQMPLDLINPV